AWNSVLVTTIDILTRGEIQFIVRGRSTGDEWYYMSFTFSSGKGYVLTWFWGS
ncbi:hypothetical protein MKW98_029854, partial [Papaver atlanticum]